MMKKGFYLVVAFALWACSPESIVDCFTSSGSKITQVIELDNFTEITIRKNIELRISYAEQQKISVEAGRNSIDGIEFQLKNNHLEIKTEDLCASGSRNAPYIVHLETPNLTEIRNSSQFDVFSTTQLTFNELLLISENYNDELGLASGNFDLDVSLQRLQLVHAGLSEFTIRGNTNRFGIEIYSGSGRIFAENLITNQLSILHRGYGDVHVFPVENATGKLLSTGNLILHNQPQFQDIEVLFTGRIIVQTE